MFTNKLRESPVLWLLRTTGAADYPVDIEAVSLDQLQRHCDWTKQANITDTPTFFVDGHELAREVYDLATAVRLVGHVMNQKVTNI